MSDKGRLFVFEGPDHVGKTSVSLEVSQMLFAAGVDVVRYAFPGHESGTLGKLVYDFHHSPKTFGIKEVHPLAVQVTHVAAHIDAIHRRILPWYNEGKTILLDRFYWSTIAYSVASNLNQLSVYQLATFEAQVWDSVGIQPDFLFIIDRNEPIPDKNTPKFDIEYWQKVREVYGQLAGEEIHFPVGIVSNEDEIQYAASECVVHIGLPEGTIIKDA